jgi:hypothetical protein
MNMSILKKLHGINNDQAILILVNGNFLTTEVHSVDQRHVTLVIMNPNQ